MDSSKKYSIVCYLEGEPFQKVRALQEELFSITGSRKCLDSWTPHITLGSGIIVGAQQQEQVEHAFQELAHQQSSFALELKGFGGTTDWKGARAGVTTPFVLWVEPIMNKSLAELFHTIADNITSQYETFYPRIIEYVPHVTVAYGDLSKEGYDKGWEYLQNLDFQDTIEISHVALVENFPDKDIEYKRYYFKTY